MLQNYPKISIVTPSYNQGDFIEETILSILNQNYPNLEYIIIDGGSTDNTLEIIKKYENHLTYWLSEKDKGQSDAINKGLKRCTGEIFNWINSDDILAEGSLWKIGKIYAEEKPDLICGRLQIFGSPEERDNQLLEFQWHQSTVQNLYLRTIVQAAMFYQKSLIDNLGGLNETLHYTMDLELWIKSILQKKNLIIAKSPKTFAYFRLHQSSKTQSNTKMFRADAYSIEREILKQCNVGQSLLSYCKKKGADNNYKLNLEITENTFNKKEFIRWFCVREFNEYANQLSFKERWILTKNYIKVRTQKQLKKEFKMILGDYLFPNIYKINS